MVMLSCFIPVIPAEAKSDSARLCIALRLDSLQGCSQAQNPRTEKSWPRIIKNCSGGSNMALYAATSVGFLSSGAIGPKALESEHIDVQAPRFVFHDFMTKDVGSECEVHPPLAGECAEQTTHSKHSEMGAQHIRCYTRYFKGYCKHSCERERERERVGEREREIYRSIDRASTRRVANAEHGS